MKLRRARLASLREPHKGVILQFETQEELYALLPSHRGAAQSVLRPHEVPVAQRSGREGRLRENYDYVIARSALCDEAIPRYKRRHRPLWGLLLNVRSQ